MGERISQETAISRFKKKWEGWEERYDYSKVIYINQSTPVTIECLKHGPFRHKPCDHWLGKQGCDECKKDEKRVRYASNTAEFILESREIHGEKYIYHKVDYFNARTKVTITCPEHGDFEQTPDAHIGRQSQGCPECGNQRGASKNALPFEVFEERSKIVHLGKYKYFRKSYFSASRKTKIKCPVHGFFHQLPDSHLRSAGCKKCAVEAFASAQRLREENRVRSILRSLYGTRYKVMGFFVKTDSRNKRRRWVKAECLDHGSFEMPCSSLISRGSIGCLPCKHKKIADRQTSSTAEFIARATSLHEGFYDYSKVDYQKAKVYVTITCPIHGDFKQSPDAHLRGSGCNECANASLTGKLQEDTFPPNFRHGIYLIELTNIQTREKFLKVGLTSTSVKARFSALSKAYKYKVIAYAKGDYSEVFKIADKQWIKEIKSRELAKPPKPSLHPKGRSFGSHECAMFNSELMTKYSEMIFELAANDPFYRFGV